MRCGGRSMGVSSGISDALSFTKARRQPNIRYSPRFVAALVTVIVIGATMLRLKIKALIMPTTTIMIVRVVETRVLTLLIGSILRLSLGFKESSWNPPEALNPKPKAQNHKPLNPRLPQPRQPQPELKMGARSGNVTLRWARVAGLFPCFWNCSALCSV